MYLRHGFRRPNFGTKFGASVMGVGPYAPRGDEGRHAGSSCPTGGCGEPPRLPWGAAHSGASAPAGARDGRESRQRLPQKCPATSDNPSVSLRLTAPFTQGSLGDGDADRRVASLLAMTALILCHSEEAQRADVGIRPFYDGRGFGPPSRRPLRVVAESRRNHPGSALSAEREAGQIRSLPDDLGVQHGVQGSEV